MSLLNIAVFSTVLLPTFLLSDSGGPTAVDIHDVPIVPAATVISAVNTVPVVAGPTVLAILLFLSFLLLLPFLLLWAVTLLLSSLLLLIAGVIAIYCFPAAVGITAVAGVS